jgi:hypothetical protein
MADDLEQLEQKGIEHLEKIEHELEEIKQRTGGRWNSLRNGLWQGVGAVIGSILGVLLIGFLLSLFGVIPGLSDAKNYIEKAAEVAPHR